MYHLIGKKTAKTVDSYVMWQNLTQIANRLDNKYPHFRVYSNKEQICEKIACLTDQ